MNEVLGPGFHRISKAHYLSDPCDRPSLSSGIAHLLLSESPAHAWAAHPRGLAVKDDPTAAMIKGTAVDSLLLGGDTELVVMPEMLPNAKGTLSPTNDELRMDSARAWAEEQKAAGRQVVKRAALAAAQEAAAAITKKLAARGISLHGEHQVCGIWEDMGVLCRMRLDHLVLEEGLIYDLKIVDRVHPRAIARKMDAFGYDIQHAAYVRGIEALKPELAGRVRMKFIFAEAEPPYDVVVCRPDGELRALGESKWRRALIKFGACLRTKQWPGHADGEIEIRALPWAMAEEEEASVAA
jgi:PDDEXK-like domain of unknown function (DUF3799)